LKVRLQKFLAEAGVASRRASEEIIVAGKVAVNGRQTKELGTKIDPATDEVTLDGNPIQPKRKLYLALNKPKGYICSRLDPLERRGIADLLPKEWHNLYSVGRLDYDTEGLIFLTNDGQFALQLTHPRYGVSKKYLATVEGKFNPEILSRMVQGITHEGQRLKAERARLLKSSHSQTLIELVLTEGKNREVRRLFESQGLVVAQLKRVQIGPIKLGELPSGRWRTLTESEIKSLLPEGTRKSRMGKPGNPGNRGT
jgi:23S rRNA pseudouridine2605 synthase